MIAYEKLLLEHRPDLVVVVGDVNSTVAVTLAAVKLGVKAAHLEAGLRSFDRSMPEEINRIVTDSISDILWTPSPDGDENLLRGGIAPEKIERVGNIMIDSLEMMRPGIMAENAVAKYGLKNGAYGVVTLHRPSNVDRPEALQKLCNALQRIAAAPQHRAADHGHRGHQPALHGRRYHPAGGSCHPEQIRAEAVGFVGWQNCRARGGGGKTLCSKTFPFFYGATGKG